MITVRGEPVTLKYTWQSIRRLWKEQSINLMEKGQAIDEADPDTVTKFLWAGVLHQVPDASLEDIDFPLVKMAEVRGLMERELQDSMEGMEQPDDPFVTTPNGSALSSNAGSID